MSRTLHASRTIAAASIALLGLTALLGCERRPSDVPAPAPSAPTTPGTSMGTTGSADSSASMPGTGTGSAPMPGSAASDAMQPASAASR